MIAVFVFMAAFFLATGTVTALAEVFFVRRRGPVAVRRPVRREGPPPWTAADEKLLMSEIEDWLARQSR